MVTNGNIAGTRSAGANSVLAAFGRAFAQISEQIREHRARRRVVDELSRMSERELMDIGLTRFDVPVMRVFGVSDPANLFGGRV
jgi:uncharacterized protein YjiS (DUF1127 family)